MRKYGISYRYYDSNGIFKTVNITECIYDYNQAISLRAALVYQFGEYSTYGKYTINKFQIDWYEIL